MDGDGHAGRGGDDLDLGVQRAEAPGALDHRRAAGLVRLQRRRAYGGGGCGTHRRGEAHNQGSINCGVIFPRKMTVVHSPAHRQGEETRKPLGRKTSAGSEDRLKVRPFPHSSQEDAASSSAKGGTIFLVKFVLFTTSQNG